MPGSSTPPESAEQPEGFTQPGSIESQAVDLAPRAGAPLPRAVFVGGCPRSGTTLLGAMLGVGPAHLTVPEARFKWKLLMDPPLRESQLALQSALERLRQDWKFPHWNIDSLPNGATERVSYSDLLSLLALAYGQSVGKPSPKVWIDHTPKNMRYALSLAGRVPDAKFIHLLRDGRAVAASILPLDWGPNDIVEAAWYWARQIAPGLAAAARLGPDRVLVVRYEDVVAEPEQQLREICNWLGIEFDEAMLTSRDYSVLPYTAEQHRLVGQPPDAARAAGWRQTLSPRQIESFEYLTGDLLALFDYEPVYGIQARSPGRFDHARDLSLSLAKRQMNKGRKLLRRIRLSTAKRSPAGNARSEPGEPRGPGGARAD